jgi:hypothetical protein
MNIQTKIQIDETVYEMIVNFMEQNQISAIDMEGALNKTLLRLKDSIMKSFLVETLASQQDVLNQINELVPEDTKEEE